MHTVFDTPDCSVVKLFVSYGLYDDDNDYGLYEAMGFVHKGELIAGFVYFGYSPEYNTIEIAAYAKSARWSTRQNVYAVYDIPFNRFSVRMVYARHSANNVTARKLWNQMGARESIVPDIRGPGEDECIATLNKDVWLKSKYGPMMMGIDTEILGVLPSHAGDING